MPPVDLETLVSACGRGGDRKIGCETFADSHGDEPLDLDIPDSSGVHVPPDLPPESFWLSKDAEFDWFDRNAFLDRKESIKRNSNSVNLNPNMNTGHSNSNANALRLSVYTGSNAEIIGFSKTPKRRNCRLANILLFPKRLDSLGKATTEVPATEPSSPKVSCLGRVRSKRCRGRRPSNRPAMEPQKLVSEQANAGFFSRMTSFFRSKSHRSRRTHKSPVKVNEPPEDSAPRRSRGTPNPESPADQPALEGVIRLSSGRRSESRGGSDDMDVAVRDSCSSRCREE